MTSHHLYAPQHGFAPNPAAGLGPAGHSASALNNFNTPPGAHSQFPISFQPQITSFSINQVDEEEIPEEKMHSPRTPYGSVPDPINNRHGAEATRFTYYAQNQPAQAPNPQVQQVQPKPMPLSMHQLQRTVSTSSMESVQSYSDNSTTLVRDCSIESTQVKQLKLAGLHYTPTLSATCSLNRGASYSSDSSPMHSPCGTPKSCKLTIGSSSRNSNSTDSKDGEEKVAGEEKQNHFGERRTANPSLQEAVSQALHAVKRKPKNGFKTFNLYKRGLGTYSCGNSGVNTNGTVTPNSIGPLSRSSSCASLRGPGSDCSFGDHDDFECLDDNLLSSGQSTPMVMEPEVSLHIHSKVADGFTDEEEMETPIPTKSSLQDAGRAPFDLDAPAMAGNGNGIALTHIAEDREHGHDHHEHERELGERSAFSMLDDDDSDDDDEPIPRTLSKDDELSLDTLEEEIMLKSSRFQSSRVLFLDVDGVLLTTKEQATLGKGPDIKFSDEVTALMSKLCRETDCDIVISSTWQYYAESHLQYLVAYLEACGWRREKIHSLLDLLPTSVHSAEGMEYGRAWYEQSPYCHSRARGIQKIVSLYGSVITSWCALDDLPLHSSKPVCIPRAEEISRVVRRVSDAYFKPLTWRQAQRAQLISDVEYCARYALTSLPNCVFCAQSYRFGYEYNQTMIYYQADAIAKLCKLTYEVRDNGTYQAMLQGMMAVLTQYLGSRLTYQGDPSITPYLIQTDKEKGITPANIENAITLLTLDEQRDLRRPSLRSLPELPQLHFANDTV